MAASVQFRPQNRDLGMVMRDVDEDLAIFLGITNAEKERDEFDESIGGELKSDSLLPLNDSQDDIVPNAADDNFLNLEIERSDYNWLVNQSNSSIEVDVQDSGENQGKISNSEGISVKSELEKTSDEAASLRDGPFHHHSSTTSSTDSSAMPNKRPLSSGGRKATPRPATPTARSSIPSKPKPSRGSTPTSRSTLPSSKSRPSTPTRVTSRPSTPSSRPSLPIVSKSAPRSNSTPASDRSSSGRKTGATISSHRGTSPAVKSRPTKQYEMLSLSLSHDATQNPKVSVPKRPVSASRGREKNGLHNARSSSANEKPRQKSCSPPKAQAPISGGYKTGCKVISRSRGYNGNEGDYVNSVLMGTKMVDRVVNMRKLAPPKQDDYVSQDNTRKLSKENSGFGRSLSKKSLDMAIRHMDIRRSMSDK